MDAAALLQLQQDFAAQRAVIQQLQAQLQAQAAAPPAGLSAADLQGIGAAIAAAMPAPPAPVAPVAVNPLERIKLELETFSGRADTSNEVDAWLQKLEDFTSMKNITGQDITFLAQYHLRGEAANWFKAWTDSNGIVGNKTAAYQEFRTELIKVSVDSLRADDVKADFSRLSQKTRARDYVAAFRRWIIRYRNCEDLIKPTPYYSDRIILDHFVANLKPNVRVHIKMQKPATLEAAYDLANEADPIVFSATQRESQPRPPGGPQHLAGTRSSSGSPSPFSRSQSASRDRSQPPGTPLSALSQLKSLLAALEQGAGAENTNPNPGRRASSARIVPLSATQASG